MREAERDPANAAQYSAHDAAFLVPVPLFFYYPVAAGCVAYAGAVVSNSGSIGGCAVVRLLYSSV